MTKERTKEEAARVVRSGRMPCFGSGRNDRIKPNDDLAHLCRAMVANKCSLKGLFQSMDSDHSGTLSMDEFAAGLKRLDCGLTQGQIGRLVSLCDADHSGVITCVCVCVCRNPRPALSLSPGMDQPWRRR